MNIPARHHPEQDPKFRWHSTANGVGGLNRWHYANAKVDKWIEQGRIELDKKKRQELFKKAYTQIAEDSPALFLFYNKYYFYAVSNRVEIPGPTFKYDFGVKTWWAKQ